MSVRPDVTVVVPTRNRRALLGDTLRAALAQEGVDLEIIVVDEGSSDGTWEWVREVEDPRVHAVRHDVARGVAAARNAGIAAAKGHVIAFLDDDDLWCPRKLRTQLDALAATGAGWAWAGIVVLDDERRVARAIDAPDAQSILRELLTFPVSAIPAGASNVVVDAQLLRAVGGFDERFSHLADWDLWLRLAERSPGVSCPELLVAYVQHGGSMLVNDAGALLDEFDALVDRHAALAVARGVAFDRLRFARWVAWGHRRAGRRALAARIYLAGAVRHRSPGNVARAAGALLGERAWAPFSSTPFDPHAPCPDWLRPYQASSAAASSARATTNAR